MALSGIGPMALWHLGDGMHAAGCSVASPPRASHNNGSPPLSALVPLALGCEVYGFTMGVGMSP